MIGSCSKSKEAAIYALIHKYAIFFSNILRGFIRNRIIPGKNPAGYHLFSIPVPGAVTV